MPGPLPLRRWSSARLLLLFGVLLAGGIERPCCWALEPKEEFDVAASACAAESPIGATGQSFADCVEQRLQGREALKRSRHYSEFLRNFSCAQDDHGTPALRRQLVAIPVGYDACAAEAALEAFQERLRSAGEGSGGGGGGVKGGYPQVHPDFEYLPGVLAAGDELRSVHRSRVEDVARSCMEDDACEGFTFEANERSKRAFGAIDQAWLKTSSAHFARSKEWHTFVRKRSQKCAPGDADLKTSEEFRTVDVDIIREEPLIAVVRQFASPEDCYRMIDKGGNWDDMGLAYTSSGGPSSYRRSYSTNIYPPLNQPEDPITRLVAEMFSVTRNLTGYSVYPPGQEPVNAVLYKDPGDEYRPHCDGSCDGGQHRLGERIATGILYCRAPEAGGQTSFTQGALKIVPDAGDLVLFAYRYANGSMTGPEAEHSGCPLRRGRKWIATQWFREGVTAIRNYEALFQDGEDEDEYGPYDELVDEIVEEVVDEVDDGIGEDFDYDPDREL